MASYRDLNLTDVPSTWTGHAEFADWLVRKIEPSVIVELGVDFGFSAYVFAAPRIGAVYGIDSFEGDIHVGERNTYEFVCAKKHDFALSNLHLVKGYFAEVAKTWDKPIDILHIDGRHLYDDVKEDFDTWIKFVRPGGVILLHDTVITKEPFGVKRFLRELKLPKLNFIHSCGLGVVSDSEQLIKEINQQRRVWLVANPAFHFLSRVVRKLKRIVKGS